MTTSSEHARKLSSEGQHDDHRVILGPYFDESEAPRWSLQACLRTWLILAFFGWCLVFLVGLGFLQACRAAGAC